MLRLANATAHISALRGAVSYPYRDPLVEALLKDAEPAVAAFASLEIEPAMEYTKLGCTSLDVSRICLGRMIMAAATRQPRLDLG